VPGVSNHPLRPFQPRQGGGNETSAHSNPD
jgi:hypothetical protein